jgi:hypothetical protein
LTEQTNAYNNTRDGDSDNVIDDSSDTEDNFSIHSDGDTDSDTNLSGDALVKSDHDTDTDDDRLTLS